MTSNPRRGAEADELIGKLRRERAMLAAQVGALKHTIRGIETAIAICKSYPSHDPADGETMA